MPVRRPSYDAGFYDSIRQGCIDSAAVIVPMVLSNMGEIETVLDVGCGSGWFAAEFEKHGCEVQGIDDGDVPHSAIGDRLLKHDLMQPFGSLFPPVDLVVCLEVAEHLPESRAQSFIADLCRAGKAVLFSAAIPGQGGTGHVTLRYPKFWRDLFARCDYELSMAPRWEIWDDQRVKPWYRNNLGLALPHETVESIRDFDGRHDMSHWFDQLASEPHAVIHPDMWVDMKAAYTGPR